MNVSIGLSLGAECNTVVVIRKGRIIHAAQAIHHHEGAEDAVVAALRELLEGAPVKGLRHPPISVSFGLASARIKRLSGLPPVRDADLLAAVVRERKEAFFLADPDSILTTGVMPDEPTAAWAGAIDAREFEAVRRACRVLGLRLNVVAPVAAVLPLVLPDQSLVWRDGSLSLELSWEGTRWVSARCVPTPICPSSHPLVLSPELAGLGEEGPQFAAAMGAARLSDAEPLSVGPSGRPVSRAEREIRRSVPPVVLSLMAVAAFLLSPIRAGYEARLARQSLQALENSAEWSIVADAYGQLGRVTNLLAEVDRFHAGRRLMTPLLGRLADQLPESAALQRLEVNGDTATLVAVTQERSALIDSLQATGGVAAVETLGAPQPEVFEGREVEKVTIRVVLRPPDSLSDRRRP